MPVRKPIVAGMFYPRDAATCRREVDDCVARGEERAWAVRAAVPGRIVGGVVPHAGWVCSGAVAGRVFAAIAGQQSPGVVVVFGAIHVAVTGQRGFLFESGAWETPLGLAGVAEELCAALGRREELVRSDAKAHEREHSIEVEVPFVQRLLPGAKLVPIMVPVNEDAAALGRMVGEACKVFGGDAVFLASTDLTHYGPSYGFTPKGVGSEGLAWAKDVNDRRMVDLMMAMREGDAVGEAQANHNACGAGAIAATIAACKAAGAERAVLLGRTTSYDELRDRYDEAPRDAVGYAGLVYCAS